MWTHNYKCTQSCTKCTASVTNQELRTHLVKVTHTCRNALQIKNYAHTDWMRPFPLRMSASSCWVRWSEERPANRKQEVGSLSEEIPSPHNCDKRKWDLLIGSSVSGFCSFYPNSSFLRVISQVERGVQTWTTTPFTVFRPTSFLTGRPGTDWTGGRHQRSVYSYWTTTRGQCDPASLERCWTVAELGVHALKRHTTELHLHPAAAFLLLNCCNKDWSQISRNLCAHFF